MTNIEERIFNIIDKKLSESKNYKYFEYKERSERPFGGGVKDPYKINFSFGREYENGDLESYGMELDFNYKTMRVETHDRILSKAFIGKVDQEFETKLGFLFILFLFEVKALDFEKLTDNAKKIKTLSKKYPEEAMEVHSVTNIEVFLPSEVKNAFMF